MALEILGRAETSWRLSVDLKAMKRGLNLVL